MWLSDWLLGLTELVVTIMLRSTTDVVVIVVTPCSDNKGLLVDATEFALWLMEVVLRWWTEVPRVALPTDLVAIVAVTLVVINVSAVVTTKLVRWLVEWRLVSVELVEVLVLRSRDVIVVVVMPVVINLSVVVIAEYLVIEWEVTISIVVVVVTLVAEV